MQRSQCVAGRGTALSRDGSWLPGAFEIYTIAVDNWEYPSVDLPCRKYIIDQQKLDVLHIPSGYITAIRSLDPESALMAMSDHLLGAVKDEYRFPLRYFKGIF
ncbi:hypothetical protein LWM68_21205 [Niabella sp. W65]|nr:hypothetical protein [Niabella sp. W65]MCH7365050.1 hypothetical protein [Niabella sp. W65]ULT40863.1 hypothetical protein KRR40_40085 [Niabella sp. I65]